MVRSFKALLLLSAALGAAVAAPAPGLAHSGGAAPNVATAASGGAATVPDDATSSPSSPASRRRSGGASPSSAPKRSAKPRRAAKPSKPAKRRAAPRAPVAPVTPTPVDDAPAPDTVAGVFPVVGTYTFGGDGSRFGAGRPGHIHQGQDVSAANGTPLVAPVAGTITWKANQPGGAGIYLVLRGAADGRDYVFMHLRSGSVLVDADSAVAAGQQLAEVGATGVASGPHLHFEIWVGGWQERGGAPIDPLPQLQRWATG